MQIEIKPEDIDKLVSEAILKSALAAEISKGVQNALKTNWQGNGLVSEAVASFTRAYVAELLRNEDSPVGAEMRAMILVKVQEFIKTQAAMDVVNKILSKINSGY